MKQLWHPTLGWLDEDEYRWQMANPTQLSNRSELAAPTVIRDGMPAVMGMHDGQMYDSKRAMRESYREHNRRHGTSLIEVGNDPIVTTATPWKKPKVDRKAIRASVDKALSQAGLGENPVITGIKDSSGRIKRARNV